MDNRDLLLLLVLVVCCYTDLRSQKIYNVVLLPAVIVGLILNVLDGGWGGLFAGVKGLLLGLALLIIPFALGGIGAGDVKLLGAVGAIKGPEFALVAFLAGAVAGGLISAALLIKNGQLALTLKKIYYTAMNKLLHIPVSFQFNKLEVAASGEAFPYGVAIGLGVLWVYVLGWLNCGVL